MAEKARHNSSSREAAAPSQPPPPIARRASFKKSLREIEGSLPAEYLEALEGKRKQLDESIHKYIASKEREYKSYERDLKQQAKSNGAAAAGQAHASGNGTGDGNGSSLSSASKRRTSSESTVDTAVGSPFLAGQQQGAVDALLASGTRRERPVQSNGEDDNVERRAEMVGLADRRDSEQREKEFIGLFTPPYLPAIDDKEGRGLGRTESAPAAVDTPSIDRSPDAAEALPRADSDTSVQAKAKRPVHLQLAKRTSSSGSSADGKLASAMKSPKHSAQRPKSKRVSLAVGDSIVAPSDNVPSALSRSSTPSHSRTLSPESEREHGVPTVPTGPTTSLDFARQPPRSTADRVDEIMNGTSANANAVGKSSPPQLERAPAAPAAPTSATLTPKSPSGIDPDGDLFDLEEESDPPVQPAADGDFESAIESEEDAIPGLAGRIEHGTDLSERSEVPLTSPSLRADEKLDYDPEAGLVPEPASDKQPIWDESSNQAKNLTFSAGSSGFSSSSSQQPTNPGFRRPSVSADPIFRGPDYATAEARAATEEIYGSSYSRPTSKGSFTAGSLGESYMVKHAEEMMKVRLAKREQEVR